MEHKYVRSQEGGNEPKSIATNVNPNTNSKIKTHKYKPTTRNPQI